MSWGGIKRDKYDILFSYLVRERSNWICEYCHRDFNHNHGGLHCSHFYGRSGVGTRWHPWNAFSHCFTCHQKLGDNPPLFAEWVEKQLGSEKFARLRIMGGKPTKMSKFDKEIIHTHYLKEKKRILKLRDEGSIGRLEFLLP